MKRIQVCNASDILPGSRKLVEVDFKLILIVNHQGTYFAMDNVCPHAKGSLYEGRVEDDGTITCLNHGTCFDLRTGAVRIDKLDEDLLDMIDPEHLPFGPLQLFNVEVEDGMVMVEVPD